MGENMTEEEDRAIQRIKDRVWGETNIKGIPVLLVKIGYPLIDKQHFCAYAELENSRYLSDLFLSPQTFRAKDWVGVDTAHGYNMDMSMEHKLLDALQQMQQVIEKWQEATWGRK
jgi:hypothetical protein